METSGYFKEELDCCSIELMKGINFRATLQLTLNFTTQ